MGDFHSLAVLAGAAGFANKEVYRCKYCIPCCLVGLGRILVQPIVFSKARFVITTVKYTCMGVRAH
eukprot:jgi/Botrbrau1/23254/Bobra.0574s0001.1